MAQQRIDSLFASENWKTVYTAFTTVDLKSYDFDTIREALLTYISITYPDKFNDFIASSEFIAILDLVAYLGHSLAFRTDLNSRENFLDTAERRESILRLAKTLGYDKSRPTNARGFLKITSIKTNQSIKDSFGKSLANKRINWNDSNNDDWYDDFVTVLNSALSNDSKIDNPSSSLSLVGGENYIHYLNENKDRKSTRYSYTTNIASSKRKFDVVRAEFTDGKILESEPNSNNNMTIIARDDNLGPASDRTGFFVFSKAGDLRFKDFDYTNKISNRVEQILDANISNTDVWIQKLTDQGTFKKSVTIVDNTTTQNAIYNSLRSGATDLASVQTLKENSVQITYPDGIYGNAAHGKYRVWYRVTDNTSFTVNRDDIRNVNISIPYIGEDGRPYTIDLTLNSTLDFTENFVGENYYSVKRLAPQAYYTQDRMVNGQDYNVLPLTLGTNIVTKSKAVNTTFSGNSRFFEMDDVTGHHSTITVNGTDGSVYFEDTQLKTEFYLNPQQADIDSFIRNDLVKTISHPIIENQFYYLYKNDTLVKRDFSLDNYTWNVDPSNPSNLLKGIISPSIGIAFNDGDYLKIGDHWYTVMDYTGDVITLDRPAIYGKNINEYVYGFVKVFTDDQVEVIKNIINDNNTDTFYISFDYIEGESLTWVIRTSVEVDQSEIEAIEESGLYVKVEYKPGIRRTESRFIATIVGKNIVFESIDQVKFFYSNNLDTVIDNETNKAANDAIFINYHSGFIQEKGLSESEEYTLTVGYGPVTTVDEVAGTFVISYENTGANINYDYIETVNPYITGVTYNHELVSPSGLTAEIPVASPLPYSDGTYDISTVSSILQDITSISEDVVVDLPSSNLNNILVGPYQPLHDDTANTSNVESHINDYIDISKEELQTRGFSGNVTLSDLSTLINDSKLYFVDVSSVEDQGSTKEDAELGDIGTQSPVVSTDDNINYRFTFFQNETFPVNDLYQINENDADIYFKQIPYSQIDFVSLDSLTKEEIFIRLTSGLYSPSDNWTFLTDAETGIPNTYRIIFWRNDVLPGDTVDVYSGTEGSLTQYTYHGRITATIQQQAPTTVKVNSYKTIGSMVTNKYVTDQGYIDYSKVIVSSKDIDGDPYAMIDMITSTEVDVDGNTTTSVETTHYVVLEKYTMDDNDYERASSYAVAYAQDIYTNTNIPETAKLYYDVDASIWYRLSSNGWVETTNYTVVDDNEIIYGGTNYVVTEGKSFVLDEYMSYRWDHYADKDKRIDPSTSNIIDVYVLTTDYVRRINEWKEGGFITSIPVPPTTFELNKLMENINTKAAIADHVSYIPAKFKFLFGDFADEQNQAYFKVVKRAGTTYTDSEIKSKVAEKVNEYFDLNKWDFGETFFFSELAAYLHVELGDYIASVTITPKYAAYDFRNMLSISCETNEIFMSLVSSANVKIIDKLTNNDLTGE